MGSENFENGKMGSGNFEETGKMINVGDVGQGRLGDCYLISTLAAIAEAKGAISNCFVTKKLRERENSY